MINTFSFILPDGREVYVSIVAGVGRMGTKLAVEKLIEMLKNIELRRILKIVALITIGMTSGYALYKLGVLRIKPPRGKIVAMPRGLKRF